MIHCSPACATRTISGTSTLLQPGSTTSTYDVNNNLVAVTDATKAANNRSFVNDVAGRILQGTQNGNTQRQLVVNGEVLGRYGTYLNADKPADSSGNPLFTTGASFNFGYSKISGSYPGANPGTRTVAAGESLQSIAKSVYGDSSLWYLVADANGLGSDRDLRVGQTLNVPNRVTGAANNSSSFKPYSPGEVVGNTTPNLPSPPSGGGGGGCGVLGTIIMVVVAAVVTYFSAGALGGSAWAWAAGGAIGSVASQAVGIAIGAQEGFNWGAVAMAAISSGIGAGVSEAAQGTALGTQNAAGAAARAAIGNAMTQGVAVATGLQDRFSWASVAASAVGAGVGHGMNQSLGLTDAAGKATTTYSGMDQTSRAAFSSFASGAAATLARGGKVEVTQIATDVFGNALGDSFVSAMRPSDPMGDFIAEKVAAQEQREQSAALYGFGSVGSGMGLRLGGGSGLSNGGLRGSGGDGAYSAQRDQEWIAQSDAIQGRRLDEFTEARGDAALVAMRDADIDAQQRVAQLPTSAQTAADRFDDGASFVKRASQQRWADVYGPDWGMTETGGANRSGGVRYRPGSLIEVSRNQGRDAVFDGLDDITGYVGLMGDYRVIGNALQLATQTNKMQTELADIRKDLIQLGKKPPLEYADAYAPGDGARVLADKLAEHRNYVRLSVFEKAGVVTLNDDFSIRTIGKDQLAPGEFVKELGRVYEGGVSRGSADADQRVRNGQMFINTVKFGDGAEMIAKGNYVDNVAKTVARDWLDTQRVPEGAFGLVSINRRFTDTGNIDNYRMPDLLVNYGPRNVFALDATLGTKTATTPQVRDSLRYGVAEWANVTPRGTQWISNSNIVPTYRWKK